MFRGNFNSVTILSSQVDRCEFAVWEDLALWVLGTHTFGIDGKLKLACPCTKPPVQEHSTFPCLHTTFRLPFYARMTGWISVCVRRRSVWLWGLGIGFVFSCLLQVASNCFFVDSSWKKLFLSFRFFLFSFLRMGEGCFKTKWSGNEMATEIQWRWVENDVCEGKQVLYYNRILWTLNYCDTQERHCGIVEGSST